VDKVLLATQGFCREQLALKHRYVMALHTDEPHPHVHVIVKAVSEQGERMNIRNATLREWREESRATCAGSAPPPMRRRASAHMRARIEAAAVALRDANESGEQAKQRVRETRRELERGWLATSESLSSQGQTALAEQARQFVRDMPPARTEREWLMAGLLEQGRIRRAQELEMTR